MSEEIDPLDDVVDEIAEVMSKKNRKKLKKIFHNILSAACGGQVDGSHHKAHSLDQIVRFVTDCPTIKRSAKDCNGEPYGYETLEESEFYRMFVEAYEGEDGDGEKEYTWETGIPA